jgi:SAM-dependent methyltransferase
MPKSARRQAEIGDSLLQWFRDEVEQHGLASAVARLFAILWEFLRESMPDRRRQRYGDVDYDWDHRVDTTGATVGWRERLVGLFHSPYQPTEPALFHEMLASLNIDFREFVFIDIGSGKGRVLLMAADYPFRGVLGIELFPELHRVAEENIRTYKSDSQRCFAIESTCGDARDFAFPPEPLVLYLFNPLPEAGFVQLLRNLEGSLREHPRAVYVLYHNPLLEHVLASNTHLCKFSGTHQYSILAEKM